MRESEQRIFISGLAYSLIAILLLVVPLLLSSVRTEAYSLTYALLTVAQEGILIALPVWLLCRFSPLVRGQRLRGLWGRPGWGAVLALPLAFFAYFAITGLTLCWLGVLILFGPAVNLPQTVPLPANGGQLAMGALIVGLVPALCEEYFCRDLLLTGFARRLKPWQAIALSGALFAILHGQVMALPGHLALGLLLAWLTYVSRSIWPSVILHFTQNSLSLLMGLLSGKLLQIYDQAGLGGLVDQQQALLSEGGLAYIVSGGLVFITFAIPIAGVMACFYFAYQKRRKALSYAESPATEAEAPAKLDARAFLPFLPGLLVALYKYVASALSFFGVIL